MHTILTVVGFMHQGASPFEWWKHATKGTPRWPSCVQHGHEDFHASRCKRKDDWTDRRTRRSCKVARNMYY